MKCSILGRLEVKTKARRWITLFFALSLGAPAFAQNADVTAAMVKAALKEAEERVKAAEAAKKAKEKPAETKKTDMIDEESETEIPDPRVAAEAAKAKAHQKTFSGIVNVLRQGDRVEVVFKTSEIFLLPRGAKQHAIFKALQESENTGGGVSIVYDDRSMVIESASKSGSGAGKSK